MKKNLFMVMVAATMFGCGNRSAYYDRIWKCTVESYSAIGMDIDGLLDELEMRLVVFGVIGSASGKSYKEFFSRVAVGGMPVERPDLSGLEVLGEICRGETVPPSACPGMEYDLGSGYKKLTEKLSMLGEEKVTDPVSLAGAISSSLSPADFEIPALRMLSLLAIYVLYDVNTVPYPTRSWAAPPAARRDSIPDGLEKVMIATSESDLFWDGRKIDIVRLPRKLAEFIKVHKSKHHVVWEVDRSTLYALYIEVQAAVSAAYDELCNEEARTLYKKNYEELDEKQMAEIMNTYPDHFTRVHVPE